MGGSLEASVLSHGGVLLVFLEMDKIFFILLKTKMNQSSMSGKEMESNTCMLIKKALGLEEVKKREGSPYS